MTADTWTTIAAVAAVLIAAVALFYSRRSTQAAVDQAKIQRQASADAAQPAVWADVRGDDVTGILLVLAVGNSGPAIATRARITIDPPLPSIPELRKRAEDAQRRLAAGITLPPGRIITWPLGQGFNLLKGDGPQK